MRSFTALCLLFAAFEIHPCAAAAPKQTPSLDAQAQELVRGIRSQSPSRPMVLYGTLHIREEQGRRVEIPIRYSIVPGEESWQGIYETKATGKHAAEQLIIIHKSDAPNEYIWRKGDASTAEGQASALSLKGDEARIPFAGSDYWICDLGLEFLQWPDQRLVRDAKITMRSGVQCKVLESRNPDPASAGYQRVVSWVHPDSGSLIRAEAFNAQGKRVKIFSLGGIRKIDGHWQPKRLELVDEIADTESSLEFTFQSE